MRGLLLYPEFPDSSFWSYRHVMKFVGAKAAFPPLGLITFAALMPDTWDFELIDLNVEHVPDDEMRRRIESVDAVFVSAMSVQKRSLVQLIEGPARGTKTPWVLGGPFPSSYRDHIVNPRTPSDVLLKQGLDILVWGEGEQWVNEIDRLLKTECGRHSEGEPIVLVPAAIAAQEPGSRKALNDRAIFKELTYMPPPRWDLINAKNYRSMLIQTTVGCRFRCDFCDIIQFNGGFTRPKTVESVRDELAAILALGHRGGVFTVDDNFVGNPDAIEVILHEMIEFQRRHDYPFSFYTQASLDLGSEKLAHLLPLMKQAGFEQVFLGIENPDPAALQGMNKKQNTKVDIPQTVATIQAAGIEVMAGFIFGGDEDTLETARAIAAFAEATAIPTAMTGMLTPVPYTPLAERLRVEGRLMESEYSGNNTDDEVQFIPRHMSVEEMQTGYYSILEQLFTPRAMYNRAGKLLDRLRPHIFRGNQRRTSDLRAALKSLWRQGVLRSSRGAYARLLVKALLLDRKYRRESARAIANIDRADCVRLSALVERARDAIVRGDRSRSLRDIIEWVTGLKQRMEQGTSTTKDVEALRRWGREYFVRQNRVHKFPGAYVVKAFDLSIKGLHYETVMTGIVRRARAERPSGHESHLMNV